MPAITAQRILDENNWNVDDHISIANLEYLIDNSINYINLMAGLSISNLSGSPGSVTVTNSQDFVIKSAAALCVRAYLDKGPTGGIAGASLQYTINDPHYKNHSTLVRQGINRLRGRSFVRT